MLPKTPGAGEPSAEKERDSHCCFEQQNHVGCPWRGRSQQSSLKASLPPWNTLGSSELVTVCGMSSRFVQATVVPTETVNVGGPKLKLSIFTSALSVFCDATTAKFRLGRSLPKRQL